MDAKVNIQSTKKILKIFEKIFKAQIVASPVWVPDSAVNESSSAYFSTGLEANSSQSTLTYLLGEVRLTSCLTGLDLAEQVNLLFVKYKQSTWIQTSQTGGQLYSDTSTYKVSECSL